MVQLQLQFTSPSRQQCRTTSGAYQYGVHLESGRLSSYSHPTSSHPPPFPRFPRSSHNSDVKMGTLLAALPGSWIYRVSLRTGRPANSILCLDEIASLICHLYLRVAVLTIVQGDLSLRYTLPVVWSSWNTFTIFQPRFFLGPSVL